MDDGTKALLKAAVPQGDEVERLADGDGELSRWAGVRGGIYSVYPPFEGRPLTKQPKCKPD